MTTATQTVKERPILFSGEMVRAILEGRKTQTRRIIKPQPNDPTTYGISPIWGYGVPRNLANLPRKYWPGGSDAYGPRPWESFGVHCATNVNGERVDKWISCPYGKPGDRLWVRETFCWKWNDDKSEFDGFLYAADGTHVGHVDGGTNQDGSERSPWKPSIHMPREASRITLEITSIRVERLQDISQWDAWAEGCPDVVPGGYPRSDAWFYKAWEKINGKKHPWASNPWVWVVEFKKI